MNGYGKFSFEYGNANSSYEGWYKDGQQQGLGYLTAQDGSINYGRWREGQQVEFYDEAKVKAIEEDPNQGTFNTPKDFEQKFGEIMQRVRSFDKLDRRSLFYRNQKY